MKKLFRSCSCVLALAATSTASLPAAEPAAAVQSVPGSYQFDQLHSALTRLGYEFYSSKPESNQIIVVTEQGDLKLYVCLTLNPEYKSLWMSISVAEIPQNSNVAPIVLKRLLEENDKIGPAFFQFSNSSRHISLQRQFDNRDWTPARLRREIEAVDEIARTARPLWRSDNFLRQTLTSAEASRAELGRLRGTYRVVKASSDGKELTAEQLSNINNIVKFDGENADFIGLAYQISVDPLAAVPTIDMVKVTGEGEFGIYRREGDMLVIRCGKTGEARPADFNGTLERGIEIHLKPVAQ
jgi:uncharacterized protein (TIGR03067 family)